MESKVLTQYLFCLALTAIKQTSEGFLVYSTPRAVVTSSLARANEMGREIAFTLWPAEDGYTDHASKAVQVQDRHVLIGQFAVGGQAELVDLNPLNRGV